MSWSITVIGKGPAVKKAVNADTNLPQPLKDAVALFADANGDRALRVETSGHYSPPGSSMASNVYQFKIDPITLLPD